MPLGWRLRQPAKGRVIRLRPGWGALQKLWETDEEETGLSYETMANRYRASDLVYMCIKRLSFMAALEQLLVYDPASPRDPATGIPTKVVEDHPFLHLWQDPNDWDSRFELLRDMVAYTLISGNSFLHFDDGAEGEVRDDGSWFKPMGEPVALWTIRPDRAKPKRDNEKMISYYQVTAGEQKSFLPVERVRHFKDFHPLDDYMGLSSMEPATLATTSDIDAQRSNRALHRNGMRLSMLFASDKERVDPDQLELMEKMLLEQFTGSPDKAHQAGFIWEGFKPQNINMTPRDAEFIEAAKMNRMRIFGIYGVHPAVILSEDVNLANAEVGEYITRKFTLAPLLEMIASDLTPALRMWPDAPPGEVHFPNVVPQNRQLEAEVQFKRAEAVKALVDALGPVEGALEAQRQGLISKDVQPGSIPPPTGPALPGKVWRVPELANGHNGNLNHDHDVALDGAAAPFFRRYP